MTIFTDGGGYNNGDRTGDGAWAFTVRNDDNSDIAYVVCGFESETTNNRTEMLAAINAIKMIQAATATHQTPIGTLVIVTDSIYLANGYHDPAYLDRWSHNGWITSTGTPVKNIDLWKELMALSWHVPFKMQHIRGHMKCPERDLAFWNSIVDKVCTWVMREHTELTKPTVVQYNMRTGEINIDYLITINPDWSITEIERK